MKVTRCDLEGLFLVELDLHGDERGFFVERFNEARFRDHGLPIRLRPGQSLPLGAGSAPRTAHSA